MIFSPYFLRKRDRPDIQPGIDNQGGNADVGSHSPKSVEDAHEESMQAVVDFLEMQAIVVIFVRMEERE